MSKERDVSILGLSNNKHTHTHTYAQTENERKGAAWPEDTRKSTIPPRMVRPRPGKKGMRNRP